MNLNLKSCVPILAGWLLLAAPAAVKAQFTTVTNNGAITITGYTGAGGAVVIPAAIGGLPVTGIAAGAFYFNSTITSVAIPDSVATIDSDAFEECYEMTSVTFGAGIASIGSDAFAYCSRLASVTLPGSVSDIDESAFYSCSDLTNVVAGSVGTIGSTAFEKCRNLIAITFNGPVNNIGSGAFSGCSDLVSVSIPGNAPTADTTIFQFDDSVTVYCVQGAPGWGSAFAGAPTAPLTLPYPVIVGQGIQPNGFGITVSWATNATVVLLASTSLSNPVWQPLQTNSISGTMAFTDSGWTNYSSRFYTVVSQ